MARKYGLGKYGAETYDLDTNHPKVLFDGQFTVPITMPAAALTSFRKLMGSMIIHVDLTGDVGVQYAMAGNVYVNIDISALPPSIGEPWEPNIPVDWCDVPEVWIPIVDPDLPCKVPL